MMSNPTEVVEQVEGWASLDPIGNAVGRVARGAIEPGVFKDALGGSWVGHALHPILTDVVIGSFTSATVLDLIGGGDSDAASERLIGVGIAAYGPTALTGVSDWADAEVADPAVRRVGIVHAASNALALTLYATSLIARRRGRRGRGKLLAIAGATALGAAGHLGGHLSYRRGVGVDESV